MFFFFFFFFFFLLLLLLLLFLTSNKPDRHDGRVPSQQGASTTCNLTYWEVSHQTYLQTLLASLVVAKGHNSDLLSGRGGGGGGSKERSVWPKGRHFRLQWRRGKGGGGELLTKIHVTYSRHQLPFDTNNYLHPGKTFLPGTYFFLQNLPASKNWPEEQIFWGTDPLGVPVFHLPCTLHWINKLPVLARGGRYSWVPWSPLSSQGAKSHSSLLEAKL